MIDVFLGTKAQYIKTAPLLRLFAAQGIPYRLIDSGQHAATAAALRAALGVKEPDCALQDEGNIKTVGQAARWFLRQLAVTLFAPGRLRAHIFSPGPGFCIIHGDTPSTLLGLIMAKRAGKTLVHLEAGLRSFNLLRPFPEEIIRILCMRWSDVLFAPSDWAAENLRRMRVRGRVFDIGQNTNVEALYYALAHARESAAPAEPFCVVTFHRVETIMSRRRVRFLLAAIAHLATRLRVVFVQHDPTLVKLKEFGLYGELEANTRVTLLPLQAHAEFVALIDRAEFVVTDGGSIQEECAYLDKPCLVMRAETERAEGLGGVVRLGAFDWGALDAFLADYRGLRRGSRTPDLKASARVLAALGELGAWPTGGPDAGADLRADARAR